MAGRGINKVTIVGNLGNDPEVRYTPEGKQITTISVATSEVWKDKVTRQNKIVTEWHRITLFGKLAEIADVHLEKGSQVYVEGKLKTRKWQDKQGNDRYTTDIIVDGYSGLLEMLGGKPKAESPPPDSNQQPDDGIPF